MNHEPTTVIVSNRLPVTVSRSAGELKITKSPGGLVTGLADVHRSEGGLWVGHAGVFGSGADFQEVRQKLLQGRFVAVPIEEQEYNAYYGGMSNGTIWPLFHYFPGFMRTVGDHWDAYVRVNRLFADEILKLVNQGDRVWVHDYQLMLLPGMLREAMPDLHIAYFHHIPFPASEIFRILPAREAILNGLLGADLIGMHTLEYLCHFQTCATRLLGADVERDAIHYRNRHIKLGAFPLGVDGESVRACVRERDETGPMADLARTLSDKTVFLGIDRLDYTKGIAERLKAFRLFLQENPEQVGHVAFLQVCVPSRQDVPNYSELRAEVERLVGQINGEYGRPGYTPLQYLYQPFSQEEVIQFYKFGSVALVTPLRDGLNLVCKEYVASRSDDDGVLILSEFAGAAAEMGEALLVNPFDVEAMARAMQTALHMPVEERRRRMRLLRARVAAHDNLEWARTFMTTWDDAALAASGKKSRPLIAPDIKVLADEISVAPRKLLFLDYDGTLVPIRANPDLAVPSVRVLRLLARLSGIAGTEVAIVTGRSRAFCERYFGNLPVSIAAEHSAFIRLRGSRTWQPTFPVGEFERLKPVILPHLESYVNRVPGAMLEEKETALVVHYREAETVFAHMQALDLRESLSRILVDTPFSAFQAKRAIEVKPVSSNKGAAVERFLDLWGHGDEPFLTAGDDRTDEDMFRIKESRNHSIYVGPANAVARYHVESPDGLEALLQLLAESKAPADDVNHASFRQQREVHEPCKKAPPKLCEEPRSSY